MIYFNTFKTDIKNFISSKDFDDKFIISFFNDKNFRVAETNLSYRQINSLESSGILPSDRKSTKQWRGFSFKDLIYLSVVNECRKYGLENSQLKELKNHFYKYKINKFLDDFSDSKLTVADLCILIAPVIKDLKIFVYQDGDIAFTDNEEEKHNEDFSYLVINFSSIINLHKPVYNKLAESNQIEPEFFNKIYKKITLETKV